MYGTLSMLLGEFAMACYIFWQTRDIVTTLNWVAWSFTFYMLGKVFYLVWRVPRTIRYMTPRMDVPETVNREHVPKFKDEAIAPHERVVADLLRAICKKIQHAADESAIFAFVETKMSTMRRQTHERYSSITSQINVIGFEGIIGTLIGLVVFMAQATVLFKIPDIDPKNPQSTEFISSMITNLNKINLWTVSTAFFTSIIGWGVKAWIGAWVDDRMGEESASITQIQSWLEDEVLARLTLPAEITALLKIADAPDLHRPLIEAVTELKAATQGLNEVLARSSTAIDQAASMSGKLQEDLIPAAVDALRRVAELTKSDAWQFDLTYVDGGMRVTPRPIVKTNGAGRVTEIADA